MDKAIGFIIEYAEDNPLARALFYPTFIVLLITQSVWNLGRGVYWAACWIGRNV